MEDIFIKFQKGVPKKLGLKGNDIMIFNIILSFSEARNGCYMKYDDFESYTNCERQTISNTLHRLERLGYIQRDKTRKGVSYRVAEKATNIINGSELPTARQTKKELPKRRSGSPMVGLTEELVKTEAVSPTVGLKECERQPEVVSPINCISQSNDRTIEYKYNINNYIDSKEEVYSNSLDSIVSYSMLPPPKDFKFPTSLRDYEALRGKWCQSLTAYEEENGIYPTLYPNFKGLSEVQGEEESLLALWHIREHPELLAGEKWEVVGLKRIIKQYYNKTTKQ